MKVKYVDISSNKKVYDLPPGVIQTAWGIRLPGQGINGYGKKITTAYKIQYKGRMHRIYATCYSNVVSEWIVKGGQKLYLR